MLNTPENPGGGNRRVDLQHLTLVRPNDNSGGDYEEAERFLNLLDPDAETFCFQTFDDNADRRDRSLAKIIDKSLAQAWQELMRMQDRGAGVFVTVNRTTGRGRTRENITQGRALWIDDDGSEGEREELPLEPQIVVASSPGKFHYYLLTEAPSLDAWDGIQRAMVRYGCDPGALDRARVLRLPGTLHQKNPAAPYLVHIIKASADARYSWDTIAKTIPPNGDDTKVGSNAIGGPSTSAVWRGLEEGERNVGLFRYACSLRARALSCEDAQALVLQRAQLCRPPLPEPEALGIVKSAWRYDSSEPLTDLGNARRLVQVEGENLRFVPEFRRWYVRDGQHFQEDRDGEVMRRAKIVPDLILAQAAKETSDKGRSALRQHARTTGQAPRLKALVELATTESGIPIHHTELDADPFLVGVANGVLNLETGDLEPPNRAHYITKRLGTKFDPQAEAPTWYDFLNQVTGDDQELISYLHRAIGYTLSGWTAEQCLLFLYGTGANGKSTLLLTLQALMGDYARQCPLDALTMKRGDRGASNDIAMLRGARMAVSTETEDGKRFAESMIKQLTGGDRLAARFLYGEFFEFTPAFKLWIAGNHKPVIRGDDLGVWRRIHLVPFDVTIPEAERDPHLLSKLRGELSGILAWAVQGCLEWQRGGLRPPARVVAAVNTYQQDMDVFGRWIAERCVLDPNASETSNALYSDYKRWAPEAGEWVMTQTRFGTKLGERFTRESTTPVRYRGIKLQPLLPPEVTARLTQDRWPPPAR